MNLNDIRNVRNRDDYEAAVVDLVNDYHDQVGTPDDERPSKAELEKALRESKTGEEAVPPK